MRRPRLTIITNNLYVFAGGEKLALDIATGLQKDFEITMLNPVSSKDNAAIDRKKLEKLYNLSGFKVIDLQNLGMRTGVFGGESFVLKTLRPGAFASLANTIRKSDVIYLMSLNPIMMLSVVSLARLFNKKLVLGIHNFSVAKILDSRGSLKSRMVRGNLLSLLRRIKYFHVTSSRDLELIRGLIPGADVRLIPNPIRDEKKPIATNGKDFVCLYVGRLEKGQKGIDLFCEIVERALSENDRIKFAVVGAGGDGEEMVSKLASKHAGSVKRLGFLSGKPLEDAYKSASLLAFPSRYDTFSIVLLESQGRGIPAVAFDIYGPRDMIKEPFQGTLVKAFDTRRFSREIVRYFDLWKNKKSYKVLRERIRDSAYANYGKEKIFRELGVFFNAGL